MSAPDVALIGLAVLGFLAVSAFLALVVAPVLRTRREADTRPVGDDLTTLGRSHEDRDR